MRKWGELPVDMQIEEVRYYYDILSKKRFSLAMKRLFDVVASGLMLIVCIPVYLILAIAIKIDSPGPVFYRQERVTRYGRVFRICKFRTMVTGADKMGGLLTVKDDERVTHVGRFIRRTHLDEIGQFWNIFKGDMTFVGTRPSVIKYVEMYEPEMKATLLLRAGLTSDASIRYRDEEEMLSGDENVDNLYMEKILPEKMYFNLNSIEYYSFWSDISTMFKTAFALLKRNNRANLLEEIHASDQEAAPIHNESV